MKQNKEQKWYAVSLGSPWPIWMISNVPKKETKGMEILEHDMLDSTWIGEEQARENAILAASAPQWRELCRDMYLWLECYAGTREMDKHHPVPKLLEQYEKLEGETI